MAHIKPELASGKTLPLKEIPLADGEKLKQSLERLGGGEKINLLERKQPTASAETAQTESWPANILGSTIGIMAPTAKRQKLVENILAKDLADIYLNLMPEKQREFKIKGEETASKINKLLAKAKIDIGEIIKLIKKWLSLIPGINKYFLEQEAKIKADELMNLRN